MAYETDQSRRAWLQNLTASRAVRTPSGYGHHETAAGWHLDQPLGIAEHLVCFVVSGHCVGAAGYEQFTLGAGSVSWIRPGTPFTLSTPLNRRTVMYRFHLTADAEADASLGPLMQVHDVWDLRGVFDLLATELGSTLPHQDERMTGLLLVIFTSLFRGAERDTVAGLMSAQARRAVEQYVDVNIAKRFRVADLARVAGLSPDYFTRVFRKTFGMPPREWIIRRRVQHAARLLDETDMSVTKVAMIYGYPDSFLFSRQFKAVMDISPQAYRVRRAPAVTSR
ncbi:helix-turn-helix transcriptional regulator [Streptomyces sp. NEAU-Y11]|uniref:helix-turn-helix transcriptional regulator n=1 Tax=Streptomyces cucumeris TaxID=2962890 RepID=UPI0020C929A2|nr:AraC family transcriptional regulator [Streptomyces sp. NEAU-Y11]MCP9213153.1 AraC family transcriptional regulator [Streptomyces sp. NEAU-Y11]